MDAPPTEIELLHAAYCFAAGLDLRLNPYFERCWYEAARMCVTPEDVQLVVKWRVRENNKQNGRWSILVHRLVGDEDAIGVFLNQAAMARAELRRPVMDPGKASVLRATGRPAVMPQPDARQAKEVLLAGLTQLKKAVE